jgi:aminoglycoside phosphotransferase (APT) family kinase protein
MPDPDGVLTALGLPAAARTQQQNGFEATVWRADLSDGRTVAVRLLQPGIPPDRELAALRLAADYGHPAPRVIASGTYERRAAIVMTWCRGRTIGELMQHGGDTQELGELFGRAFARLHRRMDDGTVLCHLDFQPFNVLAEDGEVTGIVDWSNARAGDPREDLAWTTVVLDLGAVLLPDLAAGIPAFQDAWRAGYGALPDEAELRPFLAAAALRQQADWAPRVAAGAVPEQVGTATEDIVARWTS